MSHLSIKPQSYFILKETGSLQQNSMLQPVFALGKSSLKGLRIGIRRI